MTSLLKEQRIKDHLLQNKYVSFFYGFSGLDNNQLLKIKTQPWIDLFNQLRNKSYQNTTENRAITHHELRTSNQTTTTLKAIESFEEKLDPSITTICHIGIGGSIVGPEFIYHSLKTWKQAQKKECLFISNHDEEHIQAKIKDINLSTTLFIIVSKSGTTIEVQKIINAIIKIHAIEKKVFLKNNCIAITTKKSKLDGNDFNDIFYFDDSIGGRFSTTSYVGLVSLGLCFGLNIIRDLLVGANKADQNASEPGLDNIALTQALIRFEQQKNFQGLAIVPYGESLAELTTFLCQLICESLGKGSTINNELTNTQKSPILMHGTGPDAQHTFFQQLHQGHPTIPVEFFMVKPTTENQFHILQQIIGQSIALTEGKESEDPTHYFSGSRPSTITLLNERSSEGLGFLAALFENRIMFEGFLNNINAFDQPGVELGKIITEKHNQAGSFGRQLFDQLLNTNP